MKLLYCSECGDIIRLIHFYDRICKCGKISGKYLDNMNAEFKGPAIPIGIDNNYFANAIKFYPNIPEKHIITIKAFLIPKKNDQLKKLD
jgi:hypothetical protein